MSMETSCPPVMGNGLIDGCESCDDGNLIDGDGCSGAGELETGFECVVTNISTICEPRSAKSDDKGLVIGLSIVAVFIVIVVVIILVAVFLYHKINRGNPYQQGSDMDKLSQENEADTDFSI